ARHDFANALRLRPDHFWAQYYLALCHVRRKDWSAAQVGLGACLAMPRGRSTVWVYLLRAFAHGEKEEFAQADADFEAAAALKPNRTGSTAAERADDLVERGRLLARAGRPGDALASLEAALKLNGQHPTAQQHRAEALLALDRRPEALEALDLFLANLRPSEE